MPGDRSAAVVRFAVRQLVSPPDPFSSAPPPPVALPAAPHPMATATIAWLRVGTLGVLAGLLVLAVIVAVRRLRKRQRKERVRAGRLAAADAATGLSPRQSP